MDVALGPKILDRVLAAVAGQAARLVASVIEPQGRDGGGGCMSDMAVLHREPGTLVAGRFHGRQMACIVRKHHQSVSSRCS